MTSGNYRKLTIIFVDYTKSTVDVLENTSKKFHELSIWYLRNIKHFPCWYTVISTRVEIGKTRNCVETQPQGGVFSHNFEFFQFSRVLI